MAYDLSYRTGRTYEIHGSGTLKLHFCRNTPEASIAESIVGAGDGRLSGWSYSGGFRPYDPGTPSLLYSVEAGPVSGPLLRIICSIGPSEDPAKGGEIVFHTYVQVESSAGTHTTRHYEEAEAPDTVTASFSYSLSVEEWAYESTHSGFMRPSWAGDIDLNLRTKPVGQLRFSGDSYTVNVDAGTIYGQPYPAVDGTMAEGFEGGLIPWAPTGQFGMGVYAQYRALHFETKYQDFPFPAVFAEATDLAYNGPNQWFGFDGRDTYGDIAHPVTVGSFTFRAQLPGDHLTPFGFGVSSVADTTVKASGTIRDWDTPQLYSVPVSLSERYALTPVGADTALMTGTGGVSRFLEPTLNADWLGAHDYNDQDGPAALLRNGTAYSALTLNRASSLTAEVFGAAKATGHEWAGDDATVAVVGGNLVGTATGTTPRLYRDLKNDLLDALADPSGWYAAHSGALPTWVRDWWEGEGGGPTQDLRGPGNTDRIGRRLLSGSDVFNWSAFRYARIRAKADAPCDLTLRLNLLEAPGVSADYVVSLTGTMADHEIDLPGVPLLGAGHEEVVGHRSLHILTGLEVFFPAGRTVTLESVTLFGKGTPTVDVHCTGGNLTSPATDDKAMLAGYADGKLSLYHPTDSAWGWPVKESGSSSLLMQQLAWEISLQEGWTAEVAGSPGSPWPNLAVWLMEVFEKPCPVTLQARRSYGSIYAWPGSGYTFPLEANLGNAVRGLLFDRETYLPIRGRVRLEHGAGTWGDLDTFPAGDLIAEAFSDTAGRFRFDLNNVPAVEVRGLPGPPGPTFYPHPVFTTVGLSSFWQAAPHNLFSRAIWPPALGGEPEVSVGGGNPVLDIDRTGSRHVVWVPTSGENADVVTYSRKMGLVATEWEHRGVGVARNPWLHLDETHTHGRLYQAWEWGVSNNIAVAYSDAGGAEGTWRMDTVVTGTHPFIRVNKASGQKALTYWRDGTVYLRTCDQYTNTGWTAERVVLADVPEGVYTFDWQRGTDATMELVYSDGTDILSLLSADNGYTWS